MKDARVLCRFLLLLFLLLLFLPTGFSGKADSSPDEGPHLQISSIYGNLEDGRPSSIFVVLQNNASPSKDPVEPAFNKESARNIVAELNSPMTESGSSQGSRMRAFWLPGENATVQFMALAEGAALGIYPLQLSLNYSRLSQVTASGREEHSQFCLCL